MRYSVLIEPVDDSEELSGTYYAHIPSSAGGENPTGCLQGNAPLSAVAKPSLGRRSIGICGRFRG